VGGMKDRRMHSANVDYTFSMGLLTHNWRDCCRIRTPVSFRIQLSEMDPTPVQVSQRIHPLNPGTRVPQFADRLTTCVLELRGKQEKVLGVLDVK